MFNGKIHMISMVIFHSYVNLLEVTSIRWEMIYGNLQLSMEVFFFMEIWMFCFLNIWHGDYSLAISYIANWKKVIFHCYVKLYTRG